MSTPQKVADRWCQEFALLNGDLVQVTAGASFVQLDVVMVRSGVRVELAPRVYFPRTASRLCWVLNRAACQLARRAGLALVLPDRAVVLAAAAAVGRPALGQSRTATANGRAAAPGTS